MGKEYTNNKSAEYHLFIKAPESEISSKWNYWTSGSYMDVKEASQSVVDTDGWKGDLMIIRGAHVDIRFADYPPNPMIIELKKENNE